MSTLHRRGLILWSLMPAVLFVSKVEVFASPVASPSATSSKPAASLATPKPQRLILWDGDTTLRDAGGWSGPNSAVNTLEVTNSQAHSGNNSLHWRGAGSGLVGAAWNLFNYQKAETGLTGFDISGYNTLRLWLKVDAEPGQEPSGLSLSLSSASNRRSSPDVNLDAAVKKSSDGEWHEVVIPLQSLLP